MSTPSTQLRIYTRRQVEELIAEGRKIIILDGHVLKADTWLPFHPGGDKAILHMVGRDATDEIRALHSKEAQQYMRKFIIGRTEGRWKNFVPPIQGGLFTACQTDEAANSSEVDDGCSSSSSSTAPPSPVFDKVERAASGPRRRRAVDAESISSVSSVSEAEPPVKSDLSPMETVTSSEISSDLLKYPSLDSLSQESIVQKYRALDIRLRSLGLYECPYSAYAYESVRYVALFALMLVSLHHSQYALAGLFLGLFWHQLVFTAHDSGHMGITHDFQIDTCIGIFIADFLGGLSIGWWKRNHNVHHIVTNSPEHDPDIEHMPFFAISHRFFSSLRSTYYDRVMPFDAIAQFAIKYQDWLYYPLLTFGRFNLYRLSWEHLLLGLGPRRGPARWHRTLELLGQVFFWTWFGYGILYRSIPDARSRIVFVLVSHMVTAPLHVQITLSHFAMSTADLGVAESFPQKMLRTTMDVDCPAWMDWVHGGLQFQAVHHLFPRIPRHNLRMAQPYVREFCKDVQIPYTIYGFVDGNKEVLGRLGQVGKQARIFEECRRACTAELISGEGAAHQARSS